jgi:8-oxo-dGTP pyrophosphatase MutT (NUDIX family)
VNHLDQLARRMALHPALEVDDPSRSQAAVAVFLVPSPDRLLIIRRAERVGDPWSGQLALPGGRREEKDKDLWATAMREAEEEVGFRPIPAVDPVQLDDQAPISNNLPPISVRPWLVVLDAEPPLAPNREVAATAWVPLDLLLTSGTYRVATIEVGPSEITAPGYHLAEGLIWGLTERVITPVLEQWREMVTR